jgi:hypothetical protein
VLLIIGVPYLRFSLRLQSIPGWPTARALITVAESYRGSPVGSQKYSSGLHYCKACYAFSVNGSSYEGWFALMIGDEGFADDTAQKLRGQDIAVRYNPKRPKDSVLVDDKILGRKVVQGQSWLNPNVW